MSSENGTIYYTATIKNSVVTEINRYTVAITTSVIISFGVMIFLGLAIVYLSKLKHTTYAERYTANNKRSETTMIVEVPRYYSKINRMDIMCM